MAGLLVACAGCASFKPAPASYQPHLERAITQTNGPIIVSVAVLGRKEAEKTFGLPLHKKHIQAVWIRAQNLGTNKFHFLPASLDPSYYSPGEVAHQFRKLCAGARNRQMLGFIEAKRMPQLVPPQSSAEGFVFTPPERGAKHLKIEFVGEMDYRRLEFLCFFPDRRYDFQRVEFETLYRPEEVHDYSLAELPAVLKDLPAATTDAHGKGSGDPLNPVVIGRKGQFGLAFGRQGWDA